MYIKFYFLYFLKLQKLFQLFQIYTLLLPKYERKVLLSRCGIHYGRIYIFRSPYRIMYCRLDAACANRRALCSSYLHAVRSTFAGGTFAMDTTKIRVSQSRKGKESITDCYTFHYVKNRANIRTTNWRCSVRSCTATLTTTNGERCLVGNLPSHTHSNSLLKSTAKQTEKEVLFP